MASKALLKISKLNKHYISDIYVVDFVVLLSLEARKFL